MYLYIILPKPSEKLKILQQKIDKFKNKIKIPIIDNVCEKINTNSWFDMNFYKTKKMFSNKLNKSIIFDENKMDSYYTFQVKLFLTEQQQQFIDKWFDVYIMMYNATIKFINTCIFNKSTVPKLTAIKKILYSKKQELIKLSLILITNINKNNKITTKYVGINSHMLDYAINDACNMYDGNMTKLKIGLIKHFRLRYIKLTKKTKIIKVEKLATKGITFCKTALGEKVECSIKNFNYTEHVETVAIITKRNNEYFMLLKYKNEKEIKVDNNKIISIDPGIRTIITGYTSNGIIEIGNNVADNVKKRLLQIDNLQKIYIKQNKIEKNKDELINDGTLVSGKGWRIIRKKYNKLKNRMQDMQWKTVNKLTEYENILFGNLSTKGMGESKTTNKMTKRIGNMISLFKLKQKLKYKCHKKNNKYKECDESYTTQCCGKCGNQKKDIGSDKIYKCEKCGINQKRDVNSARLILITGTK
jgi:putative transposase